MVLNAVDDFRGWWVADRSWGRSMGWFEVRDVDDSVVAEVGWQVQFVNDVRAGFRDQVRPIKFWAEFPSSAGGGGWVKEGGFDPSIRARGKGEMVAVAVG
jgi:hypothetical protein